MQCNYLKQQMLPNHNTENGGAPCVDQFMPFQDDVSPCSKQHSSCFFNFSPIFDPYDGFLYHDHEPFLGQISHQILTATATTTTNTPTMAATPPVSLAEDGDVENLFLVNNGFNLVQKKLQRRSSLAVKKDRHSKIVTAQGPRDRRMRLSLEIARRFFDLQDKLGFDKASKTVDWLLSKSKVAIDELTTCFSQTMKSSSMGGATKSLSSTSECEVVSGIDHNPDNVKSSASVAAPKAKRVGRQLRKAAYNSISRESRAIARARAKKRTIEKKQWSNSSQGDLTQLRSSSSPLETGEESRCHTHDLKSSMDMGAEVDDPSSHSPSIGAGAAAHLHHRSICEIDDQSFTCKSDPLPIFENQHQITISHGVNSNSNHLLSFQNEEMENWDMGSTKTNSSSHAIPNMHSSRMTGNSHERTPISLFWPSSGVCLPSQFTGFQFYGKPYDS